MSFKFARFLYLSINFILGTFFFIIGAFGIALPWSRFLQKAVILFISENTVMLSLFGLGFALIGLSIVIYTLLNTKRRYADIRIGSRSIAIDESLIDQYLKLYWKEHFPHQQVPFTISIRKHFLQVTAELPFIPESEQPLFLERVKHDFSDLFSRLLGYPHDVHFIASFEPSKTEPPLQPVRGPIKTAYDRDSSSFP
ncbi:hypothetical protein [Candidatus Protochlamydia phocaeensis]|uniref:hypothetical protein n=1 Tax=Candidatus Protochlamydia phocaeensis TaxID=1414722 RepID=UPI000838F3FC|nr:hypothetical protein [Candidatus Protochlamydia phocaeensis]